MIIGAHKAFDTETHRQDEVEAALSAITAIAYQCGVDQAFKRSDPDGELTDRTIANAFMAPWFLLDYIVKKPEWMTVRARHADETEKLDLTPLRDAADRLKLLHAEIDAERSALRRRDAPHLDDEAMDQEPDDILFGTLVRHDDGRPRPVFHASPSRFDAFRACSHFGSALAVSRHARNLTRSAPYEVMHVYACWLDARKPLDMEDGGTASSIWAITKALEMGAIDMDDLRWITGLQNPLGERKECIDEVRSLSRQEMFDNLSVVLRAKGYDSIRYQNGVEGGGTSWIALSPDQVSIVRTWVYALSEEGEFTLIEDDRPSP